MSIRVFHTADNLPGFTDPAVTAGSFDGVHSGHRVLLERVRAAAGRTGGESVVVTFSPHPRQVLSPDGGAKLLNTLHEKTVLLDEAGIENLVVLPFTRELASMSQDDFVRGILSGKIRVKYFVAGFDHRFGREKEGTPSSLAAMGEELGFGVEEVTRQDADGMKVSSTAIRDLITAGDMGRAARLLGRGYIVAARTADGCRITLPEDDKLLPPPGTYRVTADYSGGTSGGNTLAIAPDGKMEILPGLPGYSGCVILTFE